MLKKTIVYTDLDGNPVSDDFYFDLSVPEIAKMGSDENANLFSLLNSMTETTNGLKVLEALEAILRLAVGKRAADNRRFLKSSEIASEFFESNAYETMYMELISDPVAMAEFMNNLIPAEKIEEVSKIMEARAKADAEAAMATTDIELPEVPAWVAESREPTSAEFASMTKEQMVEAFRVKNARVLSDASSIVPERTPDNT